MLEAHRRCRRPNPALSLHFDAPVRERALFWGGIINAAPQRFYRARRCGGRGAGTLEPSVPAEPSFYPRASSKIARTLFYRAYLAASLEWSNSIPVAVAQVGECHRRAVPATKGWQKG
jgi:hypothetical protein